MHKIFNAGYCSMFLEVTCTLNQTFLFRYDYVQAYIDITANVDSCAIARMYWMILASSCTTIEVYCIEYSFWLMMLLSVDIMYVPVKRFNRSNPQRTRRCRSIVYPYPLGVRSPSVRTLCSVSPNTKMLIQLF